MTKREDIEGTLARWLAVDAVGQIGVFTGGYAAWPSAVFQDYSVVGAADEFLDIAQPVTLGVRSARALEGLRNRPPPMLWEDPPDLALREASLGFYSFDADAGYGGSTLYYLDAFPEVPLNFTNAHPTIQRAALLVNFSSLRFADVDQIDLAKYVPVVVGRG